MKTLHLLIITVFLGFAGLMLSYDNAAYGIWVRQSPRELLNDSATIFVGNITSANVLQLKEKTIYITEENGIEKNVVENYTFSLDKYTVNIEEFLKNPQNTDKITVRQPITSVSPGMLGGLDEFHVGDRVLFYIKNLDGNNTYSPESFIIPKSCAATNVLTQNRLEARGESFTIQNGIKVDSNFTANKPIQFVDNEDVNTLSGKSINTLVHITKNTGSNPETVFSKEIHSEAKPCEWIASTEWEFIPQEGEYRMDVTITEDNETYAQYSGKFFVKSDVGTPDHMSPLKQFKSGITAEDVKCRQDLQLVIKSRDGSPACVKPDTVQKLIERGWAKLVFESGIAINSYTPIPNDTKTESMVSNDTTYLSQTVDEWKSKTPKQLDAYYKKYKDAFYDELGSFLIKDEMKKELERQDIKNIHDDFKVFPGMSLDSLPPHISYDAVVNATDGNSYLLLGGVFANKIESIKITKLVFDKDALNSLDSGRSLPYTGQFIEDPNRVIQNSDIPWSSIGTGKYGVLEIGLYASVYHMIPDAQKYYTARAHQLIPFYVPVTITTPTFATDGVR